MRTKLLIYTTLFLTFLAIPVLATVSSTGPGFSKSLQRNLGEQTVRAVYDVSISGGASATYGLGKYLPANALVTQSWIHVETQVAGTGTVAVQCEDANNIFTATDITGSAAGTKTTGASTGTAATMKSAIAAPCQISAVVAGGTLTAGKVIVFIRYVLGASGG